ncbi:hypothetical protein [Polaromonas sp.]|uniref:phage major tropism determinant n=1 Tax=Polaromonas sp. TaxID=1869339 RepID=UPI0037514F7C
MSVALQFKLTQTGQAAVWNASNTGTSLNLTHIQFGSGNRAPSGTETALLSPQQAVAIAAGFSVSSTQIRMSAIFSGNQNYVVREVGVWAGDPEVVGSKLVGYWSQAAGDLAMKSPGVDFIFSHDMTLDAAVPAGSLTILADNAQSAMLAMITAHEAKADPHPQYTTNAEVNALIEARVGDYVTSTNVGNAYTVALDPVVTAYTNKTAFAYKASAANTGATTLDAGGGAKALVREDGTPMVAGDISAGAVVTVVFDATTDSFRVTEMVASQVNAVITAHEAKTDPHPGYAKLGNTAGLALGAAGSAGVAATAARSDHVHPRPTVADIGIAAFNKADSTSVAFTKTGSSTASLKAGTEIVVAGTLVRFVAATPISMPILTAGTDYAIYACADGTVRADASFTAPSGYTTANSRKIGGFHYAPGGNATAQAGGDAAPAINAYSFWDLRFSPACPDPRGMTLVANSFWSDIYLLGVEHIVNGTSKYNVVLVGGGTPKVPVAFGGNGSNYYTGNNWWTANEVLRAYGKRSPTYDEFSALAYGTTEAASCGGDQVATSGVNNPNATSAWNVFTSRWGVIQATGCLWVRSAEFGGGTASSAQAGTDGRGSTEYLENSICLGGYWGHASNSGSRASTGFYAPSISNVRIGARGIASHYVAD